MTREAPHPSTNDITHHMLQKTGFNSVAEMSQKMMFATKRTLIRKQPFRPNVPAKLLRFDMAEVEGVERKCIILEYLDGINGETIEYAHPIDGMFSTLRFIPTETVSATYIEQDRLEKGL